MGIKTAGISGRAVFIKFPQLLDLHNHPLFGGEVLVATLSNERRRFALSLLKGMQAGAAAVGRPHRQWEGARVTPPVSLKLKALTLGFNPKRNAIL